MSTHASYCLGLTSPNAASFRDAILYWKDPFLPKPHVLAQHNRPIDKYRRHLASLLSLFLILVMHVSVVSDSDTGSLIETPTMSLFTSPSLSRSPSPLPRSRYYLNDDMTEFLVSPLLSPNYRYAHGNDLLGRRLSVQSPSAFPGSGIADISSREWNHKARWRNPAGVREFA